MDLFSYFSGKRPLLTIYSMERPVSYYLFQVHKSYPDSPGCVVLSEKPAIILAGDAFTHSNFDGCLDSAISVQQTLTKLVKSKV